MSLIIDGNTIPNTGDFVKYGNTNIDKVVCNGTTVWEKQKDIDITSTDKKGLSVSGSWSGSIYSSREDNNGAIRSITINNIDMTSYKRIVVNVTYPFMESTAGNTSAWGLTIKCGGLTSPTTEYWDYHTTWGDDDPYQRKYNIHKNASLNVSSLSGVYSITIQLKYTHWIGNEEAGGSANSTWRIDSVQLLTT